MDRQISSSGDKTVSLYLVPDEMQLYLDYINFKESVVLKGSPVQAQAEALEKSKAVLNAQSKLIFEAYQNAYVRYKEAEKVKIDEAILEIYWGL